MAEILAQVGFARAAGRATAASAAGGATAASDGSFQIQVSAPPSTREVTVLAYDSQGNSSQYRVPLIRAS